jgi:hypothetical protein
METKAEMRRAKKLMRSKAEQAFWQTTSNAINYEGNERNPQFHTQPLRPKMESGNLMKSGEGCSLGFEDDVADGLGIEK